MLRDWAKCCLARPPLLQARIQLYKENGGSSYSDEGDTLRPQPSTEENQAQKDGL